MSLVRLALVKPFLPWRILKMNCLLVLSLIGSLARSQYLGECRYIFWWYNWKLFLSLSHYSTKTLALKCPTNMSIDTLKINNTIESKPFKIQLFNLLLFTFASFFVPYISVELGLLIVLISFLLKAFKEEELITIFFDRCYDKDWYS